MIRTDQKSKKKIAEDVKISTFLTIFFHAILFFHPVKKHDAVNGLASYIMFPQIINIQTLFASEERLGISL